MTDDTPSFPEEMTQNTGQVNPKTDQNADQTTTESPAEPTHQSILDEPDPFDPLSQPDPFADDEDTYQYEQNYSTGFENRGQKIKTGDELLMTPIDPTLKKMMIGVGWDLKPFEGDPLDLDVSVFLLDKEDMTREDTDFIFYNNMSGCNDAVKHTGDNRTGAGEGDDEIITIDLEQLPYDVQKIAFVLSIYQGDEREQDFGMVRNGFFRLCNDHDKRELLYYEISEDEFSEGTGIIMAYFVREGPEWSFHAAGEVFEKGLVDIATQFGMVIGQY